MFFRQRTCQLLLRASIFVLGVEFGIFLRLSYRLRRSQQGSCAARKDCARSWRRIRFNHISSLYFRNCSFTGQLKVKQGRIHGYPSRVRVGRGHIFFSFFLRLLPIHSERAPTCLGLVTAGGHRNTLLITAGNFSYARILDLRPDIPAPRILFL